MNAIRDNQSIDHIRANGYFDDVNRQSYLRSKSDLPSLTSRPVLSQKLSGLGWRVIQIAMIEFQGVLLNQPFHESGVNKNDIVTLTPMRSNGTTLLIVGK